MLGLELVRGQIPEGAVEASVIVRVLEILRKAPEQTWNPTLSSLRGSLHTLPQIELAVDGGNGVMVKRFLESQGVARGATDDIAELALRVQQYDANGKLTYGAVDELLREVLEGGEKRVHLFRGDVTTMKAVTAAGFAGKAVASLSGVRLARTPASPVLNYALLTPERIRRAWRQRRRR